MPTLLISRSCQPEADRLVAIARASGWQHQWLHERSGPPHVHGQQFALYAETDIALRVAEDHNLVLLEPQYDELVHLPDQYTSRVVRLMTLGEAMQLRDYQFIKPADCAHKAFDAAVYESGEYILCSDDLALETPVLVSEPVSWCVEYRVIVLEGSIQTFSPYIRGGWLARNANEEWPYPKQEAEGMMTFCSTLLNDQNVKMPPAFTLDVGTIEDNVWAVVEFNPIWCSGLLGCEPDKVLPALDRACIRKSELKPDDAPWVIERDSTQV